MDSQVSRNPPCTKDLCDFIRRLIISWNITLEVRTDKGLEFIGPIDILCGILQGDSFRVTLFIMGLTLSGPGGGLRGPDGQTHSCQSETS